MPRLQPGAISRFFDTAGEYYGQEDDRFKCFLPNAVDKNSVTYSSTSSSLVSTDKNDKNVIVNEVLSYINFYHDNVAMEQMKKVALGYFLPAEVSTAKKLLVSNFAAELNDCPHKAERHKSSARTVKEAELDDIFGIIDFLDVNSKMNTVFAAVNLERIPKYSPQDINMTAIVDKHVELGTSIAVVAREVKDLAEGSLETAVAKALDPVKEQISHLTNIITQVAQLTPDISTTTATSASGSIPPLLHLCWMMEIVIYGI